LDDFNKHIQVWQTGTNTFYADIKFVGSFVTFAGLSPGKGSQIPAGIEGTMEGGYQGTFSGTLKAPADMTYKTKGNIGQFDYQGDIQGNTSGVFNFIAKYLDGAPDILPLTWWGFQYHAGQNGSWVNATSGNTGDIN
jgi:hypothetical protein